MKLNELKLTIKARDRLIDNILDFHSKHEDFEVSDDLIFTFRQKLQSLSDPKLADWWLGSKGKWLIEQNLDRDGYFERLINGRELSEN